MRAALACLIAGLSACSSVQAGEVATATQSASKLQWHARGVPLTKAPEARAPETQTAEKPVGKVIFKAPKQAFAVQPLAESTVDSAVQPALATAPVQPSSTPASRAKLRDAVMQVSAQDPPVDSSAKSAEALPEPATEPAIPTDGPTPDSEPAPLRPGLDPFADEPIPSPPSSDLTPSAGEPLPPGDLSEGISTAPGMGGCQDYNLECIRAARELRDRDISNIVVGLVIEGVEGEDFPCDCKLGGNLEAPTYVRRNFARTTFTWKATGVCHKPLYFEDVQLERYGHSWNPVAQPFMSAAHFFISVPLLPYSMGLNPPCECVYSLGYYRPGSCAPYMLEPIPFSLRAAIFEGLGGAAFAFWLWPG
jgi:hypothetical protein